VLDRTRVQDAGWCGYPHFVTAPVRKGEELEVRIDSLAYGGNGVGRVDGFVVFVRGALPGDLVRARATKVKRGFAEATRTELLEPGPGRVEAPCRHFGICGGCRFQDYAYERQIAAKEQQVRDALARLGGFAEPPVEPIVPARSVYGYRNKLEYSFARGPEDLVLGFHRAGRWDEVIDVEECLLTTDVGNAIREAVKEWARAEELEPYDQDTQAGYLRHLVVREGRNTGQLLVLLVTAPGERFDIDFLVETLTRIPEVRSIHWAVNDQPSEITNLPTRLLWGEAWIEEEFLGLRFRIRPNAFLQTNTEMAETLYELARDAAGLTGGEVVYDLYCGTGTIGLTLARDAGSVWGVEISEESVACAIENAQANGVDNANFFAGNVGQSLEELHGHAGAPDVVVVDPPRAGLAGKALRRTGALQAPRLVYVSCNPTTLASDLAVLRDEYGYGLERCTPVDMFPHTPHIESVSLLRLSGDTAGAGSTDGPAAAGATDETKVEG
jgi:23S rRNA (uracil1939-C5)-methyltransferase